MEFVPVICLEDLTENQIRAYILADNKLADAGWDKEILAIELQYLMTIEGLDFDVTVTGFERFREIDIVIGDSPRAASEPEMVTEPEEDQQALSRPGDLWQLGPHRIFCGNSLEDDSYQSLMETLSGRGCIYRRSVQRKDRRSRHREWKNQTL